jgi:ferritin-like metal-binding protein YciE
MFVPGIFGVDINQTVADILHETLEEEKAADSKLNSIAKESVNKQAERH